jgi:hypothetical protein
MFIIVCSLLCDSPVEISPRYLPMPPVSKGRSDTQKVRPGIAPNSRREFNPGPQLYRNLAGNSGAGISAPRGPEREKCCPTQEWPKRCSGACLPSRRSFCTPLKLIDYVSYLHLSECISRVGLNIGFHRNGDILNSSKSLLRESICQRRRATRGTKTAQPFFDSLCSHRKSGFADVPRRCRQDSRSQKSDVAGND